MLGWRARPQNGRMPQMRRIPHAVDARRRDPVIVWRQDFFHVENIRNLPRRHTGRAHFKDTSDNGRSLRIDLQRALFVRSERIAVWRVGHPFLPSLAFLIRTARSFLLVVAAHHSLNTLVIGIISIAGVSLFSVSMLSESATNRMPNEGKT